MMMEGPAIGLDDESSSRPVGVSLATQDQDIRLRLGKTVLLAEGEEAVLERGTSRLRRSREVDEWLNDAQRPPTMSASANRFQRGHMQQPESICLLEHRADTTLVRDFREIEEGAGNGRDRNVIPGGSVLLRYSAFMYDEPRPSAPPRSGHFDGSGWLLRQAPKRRGAPMAQQCALSPCQNSGHPPALQAHLVVAESEYAPMQAVQAPGRHATLDGSVAQTSCEQLLPRHDTVLTGRQLSESPLAPCKPTPSRLTCRRLTTHTVV